MSDAPYFFYRKEFPFCPADAPPPTDPFYDYVPLTLTEAMRIWWTLEEVSFLTLPGALSAIPLDVGDVALDKIGGSLVASDTFTISSPMPAAIPDSRICFSPENSYAQTPLILYAERAGDAYLNYIINFQLAYDTTAEEWRLYYYFDFEAVTYGVDTINASNTFPADHPTWTLLAEGTFALMGKTLPWKAYKSPTSSETTASMEGSTAYFNVLPPP